MSVTFVTPNEMDYLRVIEELTRKRMTSLRPPTQTEALEGQTKTAIESIDEMMKTVEPRRFKEAVSYLLDEYEPEELAALLPVSYTHLYDSVSNHVLTKSIAFRLSALPQSEIPQNLLLLNGKSSLATHDPYTGFMWVKGRKNVLAYLQGVEEGKEAPSNWVDFDSIDFVHQLTPQEIADLLYICLLYTSRCV